MTRTAIVTGGASGIGESTVTRLLGEGWRVWSFDVNDRGASPSGAKPDSDKFRFCRCDVTDPASVKTAFDAVKAETDKLDALVCSAGVIRIGSLEDHKPEDVDFMLGVNVKGPWLCIREALPLLRKDASVSDPSRVVVLGSIAGIRPKVGAGLYGATKAALHVLVGVFAVELGPSGVIVNAIAPGSVRTPMIQPLAGTSYRRSTDSPLGRVAEPEDIADIVMFYLSDAAKYINGTVLPADGGSRAAFVMR